MLRGTLGPERDEVTGEWRKLHNEEINDLYCLSNIVRDQIEKNEFDWACSTYGGEKWCTQGLVGKPEGKRPLGIHRRRWEENIKRDFQDVRWTGSSWLRIGTDHGLLCMR